ncbi:MAG: hypothetical protein R3F46_06705 [bacterium]
MLQRLLTIAAGCLLISVVTLGIPGGLIAAQAYSDEMPSDEIGNDWPIPVQPEPIPQTGPLPYAGWCRFIDPDSFADKLLLHDGILLTCSNHSMQAIEADTGELIWENEARDWRSTWSLTIGDGFAAWWDDALHVLSLEDGSELWSMPGMLVLRPEGNALWVARRGGIESPTTMLSAHDLLLLDASDGSILQEHNIGNLYGASESRTPRAGPVAVATGTRILTFSRDGTSYDFPRHAPGWFAAIDGNEQGIIVAAYDDSTAANTDTIMSWFSLSDPEAGWTRRLEDYRGNPSWANQGGIHGEMVILSSNGRNVALDLRDGRTLRGLLPQGPDYWTHILSAGDMRMLLSTGGGRGSAASHRILDLETWQSTILPGGLFSFYCEAVLSGQRLYILRNSDEQDILGNGEMLYLNALELDADGQPVPGANIVLRQADDFEELLVEFIASKDPSSDELFMEQLRRGDRHALLPLAETCPAGSQAHWDALLAAAQYADEFGATNYITGSAQELLCDMLERRVCPELAPVLINWLGRPELGSLHGRIRGLLAICGGEQALAWLQEHSTIGYSGTHELPGTAFALQAQQRFYADIGEQKHNDTSWSECTAPDGSRLLAYTASGLVTERDIYIAVDANSDGIFEESLATPYADVYEGFSFPGGAFDMGSRHELALEFTDGQPVLFHNSLGQQDGDDVQPEPVNAQEDWQRHGVYYIRRVLDMDMLRLDSDGDGLADLLETKLLTDPANPDTDSDGIPDGIDPAPNADAAAMGAVERGVARALNLFCDDRDASGYFADAWQLDDSGHPWRAVYLDIQGCGPVAFARGPAGYCINLATEEQRRAYEEQLHGFPAFSRWELRWQDRTLRPGEQLLCSGYAESHAEQLAGLSADELDSAALGLGFEQLDPAGSEQIPYYLYIDLTWLGYRISMVKLDGEYYPVHAELSWIS